MEHVERMSIGDFARAAGLTPKALRLYDELDLLRPADVDAFNGYRSYDASQLETAQLVAALRRVGMPLERIRTTLTLPPVAAAAELTMFWRQTEADVRSRRAHVLALVADLRAKESIMTNTRTPAVTVGVASGQGARALQQDAMLIDTNLWAVADGFGDADTVAAGFLSAIAAAQRPIAPETWDALAADYATTLPDGHEGSTFTAIALARNVATIAHLGDSRAWLLRDGVLRLLTRDHTEVLALVEDGRLTEEEARLHPRRAMLNRALAFGAPTDPDVVDVTVAFGDRLVLTTDGVHSLFPESDLAGLLSGTDPQVVAEAVATAVEAAGAPDNYAIMCLDIEH